MNDIEKQILGKYQSWRSYLNNVKKLDETQSQTILYSGCGCCSAGGCSGGDGGGGCQGCGCTG